MTDKQIICKCNDKECGQCSFEEQLKAKEQECEELKIYIESNEQQVKEVETLVMDNDRLINELDQLKAENKELKEELEELKEENEYNEANAIEFKQTLTEIKEIAESEMDSKEFMAVQCMLNGSVDNKNKVLKQILQKISEVEDE